MSITGAVELQATLSFMIDNANKASAYSLNGLAFDIRKQTQQQLPQWIHLTRQFLPNSVVYNKATPQDLTAQVGFDKRANFAMLLEQGGTRRPIGHSSIAVPVDVRTTQSGGISQANRPAALLQKQGFYIKKEAFGVGLFQSTKRIPLRLMYVFKRQTSYKKHFLHFADLANSVMHGPNGYEQRFRDRIVQLAMKNIIQGNGE